MNVDEWKAKGTCHTIHGRSLFVVDTGGQKPPLVLLHGYPTSCHDFHRVLPALAEHYRVITHDHLGFGLSGKPLDYSYSLHEQADFALKVWQHLGVKSAHLVAHDYGTSVATEILARWNLGFRPVALDSLTLCNGSVHIELAKLRFIQKLLRNRVLGPLVARLSSKRVFARNMAGLWHDPALLLSAEVDTMWDLLTRDGGKLLLPRLTQYLRDRVLFWHRWVGALRQSPLPTHFLWGADDPITGRDVAQVHHAETPNSKLVVLERAGHYPMLEVPDRWSGELLALLAQARKAVPLSGAAVG
jgi:pimeloyl-ACP methyl ester carboxylesterase